MNLMYEMMSKEIFIVELREYFLFRLDRRVFEESGYVFRCCQTTCRVFIIVVGTHWISRRKVSLWLIIKTMITGEAQTTWNYDSFADETYIQF